MQKNRLITGLDIGSSKVSAVTAAIAKDGQFSIIAQATQRLPAAFHAALS
jgi:cell division ATPase FtsA